MAHLNEASALQLCARLMGLAVVLQAGELLLLRREWRSSGVWSWAVLREDFKGAGRALWPLDAAFSERGFFILLLIQIMSGLSLIGFGAAGPAAIVAAFTSLLISVRWRGSFNGGSDSMSLSVLLALAFSSCGETALRVALTFIAAQAILSFVIAGVIKIRHRTWRTGQALSGFLRVSNYGVPVLVRSIARHPRLCLTLSWAVMLFECTFPLALFGRPWALGFIAMAMMFQTMNFYVFGLNRFFSHGERLIRRSII